MTQTEWLACADPQAMLDFLVGRGCSGRKLRLFACACCRRVIGRVEAQCLPAVEAAEAHADGELSDEQLRVRHGEASGGAGDSMANLSAAACLAPDPAQAARDASGYARSVLVEEASREAFSVAGVDDVLETLDGFADLARLREAEAQCSLLREIVGGPFGPPQDAARFAKEYDTIVALARAAYEERLPPEGTLDPARLAVMADALEEAGADAELLGHLRGPGPHVRGCWVLGLE